MLLQLSAPMASWPPRALGRASARKGNCGSGSFRSSDLQERVREDRDGILRQEQRPKQLCYSTEGLLKRHGWKVGTSCSCMWPRATGERERCHSHPSLSQRCGWHARQRTSERDVGRPYPYSITWSTAISPRRPCSPCDERVRCRSP
jgi:hypothetical protein